MRFWVSWWTSQDEDKGCTTPPFDYWTSGYRFPKGDMEEDTESSVCAVIDADTEDDVWEGVAKYFPDYEARFCEEREADYAPGSRFSGFENNTSLA